MREACVLITVFLWVVALRAEDWPNWRGPSRNGNSAEKGWLEQWPPDGPKILWKSKVGTGLSSFSVADGRVFTMGNEQNVDTIFCFDAESGKKVWERAYPADLGARFFEGGPASTPAVDGGRVYTLSRWGDVLCLEAGSGKVIWQKNAQKETSTRIPGWGFSSSPFMQGKFLVLNVGEAGMALDKTDGKILWTSANKDSGYSTPVPWKQGDKTLVIFGSSQSYLAVDPETGAEAWRVRWLTEYGLNAADAIIEGEKMFISSGYGKGCALYRLGSGEPEQMWKSKAMRNQINSSVLIGKYLFGIDGDTEAGALKCIEFESGKEQWREPSTGAGAFMAADGKLIVLSDKGELLIVPASPDSFKTIARAQVLGGKCWTTPVLANGRIYCRNARGEVVCVDVNRR
jgi:outer membrane protein assembly factor BamB